MQKTIVKMLSLLALSIICFSLLAPRQGSAISVVSAFYNGREDLSAKNLVSANNEYFGEKNHRKIYPFSTMKVKKQRTKFNYRPIIGILAQELTHRMKKAYEAENYTSYIAASYVKFVESAGARVIPVMINQPDDYYDHLAKSLNGFLLPGGSLPLDSGYSKAAKKIFNIVTHYTKWSSTPLALWATCLGFENLMYFAAGFDPRTHCKALNKADSLRFTPGFRTSQLFGQLSGDILNALSTKNITTNFHQECVLPQTFYQSGLGLSYSLLSTSFDKRGVEYVSTVEHKTLPIFGTQWHPEKAAFEWADDLHHNGIPHFPEAIRASQALAEVFIQKARQNLNHFDSEDEEKKHLIYNFSPVYVALNYSSSFQLCYFFK